jgi:hypothetical protein
MGYERPQRTEGAKRLRCCTASLLILLVLTACNGVSAATATLAPPGQAAPIILASGSLIVKFNSPTDEAVVDEPQVEVVGEAPPDTVISVNDSIVVVEASGHFSLLVPLQDGPNELDIIASDPAGNQAATRLIVTYEPAS